MDASPPRTFVSSPAHRRGATTRCESPGRPPPGRPARAFRASTAAAMATARFFVRMGHIGGKKDTTHATTTTVLFPGHFRASSLSVYPQRCDLVYSVTDLWRHPIKSEKRST